MPSPDLRQYVDLTLYDRDAQGIFDRALELAKVSLPDWTPREGNTEVVLLESLALEVSELTFATNRVPGAVAEALLKLYGLTQDPGAAATASARFTLADNAGHTIPAGTTVRLRLTDELAVDFTLDANLAVAAGATEGVGAITATDVGIAANGTAVGTTLELIDAVTYVERVVLETSPTGGQEPETSSAFLDRGAQVLRRLVNTLVLPEHFTAAALSDARVYRATSVDNYDPGQAGAPGDHAGHVTVAVAAEGGVLLTSTVKGELDVTLSDQAQANLAVHVIDPTITAVAVTATVRRLSTYTDAQVSANVNAALEAYLDPDTWAWSATVRRNELIAIIDRAEGVDYVATLTDPAADVSLSGVAPLATLGTVTLTVEAP